MDLRGRWHLSAHVPRQGLWSHPSSHQNPGPPGSQMKGCGVSGMGQEVALPVLGGWMLHGQLPKGMACVDHSWLLLTQCVP